MFVQIDNMVYYNERRTGVDVVLIKDFRPVYPYVRGREERVNNQIQMDFSTSHLVLYRSRRKAPTPGTSI